MGWGGHDAVAAFKAFRAVVTRTIGASASMSIDNRPCRSSVCVCGDSVLFKGKASVSQTGKSVMSSSDQFNQKMRFNLWSVKCITIFKYMRRLPSAIHQSTL